METTNQDTGVAGLSLDEAASRMDAADAEEQSEGDQEIEQEQEESTDLQDDTSEEDGSSEPEEAEEEEGEEWEQDGKKYNVPKALKDSLLRQADYTKKTTEVAEQRKALEVHAKSIVEERNFYDNQLRGFLENVQAAVQQMPTESQLSEMAKTDPLGYIQARAARDEMMIKQYHAQEAQQYLAKQQQAQDAKEYADMLAAEHSSLMAKLPEWKNEKVAARERGEMADYLTKAGYDSDEINGIADSRAVVIARKAMLYDKMIKGSAKNEQQIKPGTKVLSPGKTGKGGGNQSKELQARFSRSHSLDDALAILNSRN